MIGDYNFLAIGQVILAFVLGGVIGFEREYHRSPAGVRTYAAVCLGSCVFGIASLHPLGFSHQYSMFDPTRIASQVASGIGFLCAGVIFKEGLNTVGLTTAATLWATAAVGIVVAFSLYGVAVLTTAFILLLLLMPNLPIIGSVSLKKARRRKS